MLIEKTKNPEQIEVYTVQQKGVRKRIIKTTLSNFWKKDSVIRINNVDDKQETPNSEKDIRAKVIIPRSFPILFLRPSNRVHRSFVIQEIEALKHDNVFRNHVD